MTIQEHHYFTITLNSRERFEVTTTVVKRERKFFVAQIQVLKDGFYLSTERRGVMEEVPRFFRNLDEVSLPAFVAEEIKECLAKLKRTS